MLLESFGRLGQLGDGSPEHVGLDTNANGIAGNDSRLNKAKDALRNRLISGLLSPKSTCAGAIHAWYGRLASTASWPAVSNAPAFAERNDNPTNNSGSPKPCKVQAGAAEASWCDPKAAFPTPASTKLCSCLLGATSARTNCRLRKAP
jgi:hypothetical protein